MKKIGIMGGTFDPPHIGHLKMAECALKELDLEKVVFVPTGMIYYKQQGEASALDRFCMVSTAIEDISNFEVCDIETKENSFSYTAETLEKLGDIYKDAQFFFIVGADSLDYMDTWKTPEKLFALCTVVAVGRQGFSKDNSQKKAEELTLKFGADIRILDMPNIDVSSTEIRERCRLNKDISGMLPKKTAAYIKQKNLYSLEKSND